MRTLVVSDLHLGSVAQRDVLRRPIARARLLEEVARADRVVLLGDTVELLEGRPRQALEAALPVLRELGDTLGPGGELVLVPGNHDHALIAPWLRRRRITAKQLALTDRVPRKATPALQQVVRALCTGGGRVSVRYPGLWLDRWRTVLATHGHYLDCLLVRGLPGQPPQQGATPEDFERAPGPSAESVLRVLGGQLPPALRFGVDSAAGVVRRATLATLPLVMRLPAVDVLSPLRGSGVLGHRLGTAGIAAMGDAVGRLGIEAKHVVFGHIHRAGPLPGDEDDLFAAPSGPRLWNTGSWVLDPLLLGGPRRPHPYWPGGGILLEDGRVPRPVRFLDDLRPRDLAPTGAASP
ncbi:metallophosphoesterase [Conexibacter sp. SYSU D00693]|uniref:metallophosphoesterase n=1 Tax=Conexibacter sp. SYSU D00693 TaxID=2812560 RepID=UPI00196B4AAA|nr:metallophosphoesterase [Conexibacter sp. SYSU D00693]